MKISDLKIPYVEDALERADKRFNAKIDEMIPAVHRFREEMRKRVKKGNKKWWRRLYDNVNEARDLVGDIAQGARRGLDLFARGRRHVAAVAQHRKIQLRSVTATIEGGMDIQGILGIDADVRNGFDGIKVKFDIDADATREQLEALVAQSQKRSAVYDIVTNPTNVSVTVNRG